MPAVNLHKLRLNHKQTKESKRTTITIIATTILILGIASYFILKQNTSIHNIVDTAYNECVRGSGEKITKGNATGLRMALGDEVLKSVDGNAFYYKNHGESMFGISTCFPSSTNKEMRHKITQTKSKYESTYQNRLESGEYPSEFYFSSINETMDLVIGVPIGVNPYSYYAIIPNDIPRLEVANNVCSVFYEEYVKSDNVADNNGTHPVLNTPNIQYNQLHLTDNDNSLVIKINPRDLTYIHGNNLGRCIRGVLEMPERIRDSFEDDWWEYANASSSTKNSKSTNIYNWGNFEMKVKHYSSYDSSHGETKYTSEITIYNE